jgi:hypothetical protein
MVKEVPSVKLVKGYDKNFIGWENFLYSYIQPSSHLRHMSFTTLGNYQEGDYLKLHTNSTASSTDRLDLHFLAMKAFVALSLSPKPCFCKSLLLLKAFWLNGLLCQNSCQMTSHKGSH